MKEPGVKESRISIPFFEGVNSLVSFNIGKKTEFVHGENARSKMVGTIEKREGQTVLGTNTADKPFVTTQNDGLFSFQNDANQGLYRISVLENSTISINVYDELTIMEATKQEFTTSPNSAPIDLTINVIDDISVSEKVNENTGYLVTIYYIDNTNHWVPLTGLGTNIAGGVFDHTYAEGSLFLVNLNSENRYVEDDGITVKSSTSAGSHLHNSPPASRINFYKDRLYLADFMKSGVRYKTTILRSSYPMGIVGLINSDYATPTTGATIDVTDTKYIYADSGFNTYDVYRGTVKITTITVTAVNETSITGTWSSAAFQASDEIWIAGTYEGKKQFRWVNNPTSTGQSVKQYDTFKLSGGENDEITLLTNIGNLMLFANKNAMGSWNDYTLENFDLDIGCVSPRGYIKMIGTLYFLHYTGVYATSGGVPKLISNKVEKYITGATKAGKEASVGGKKGRSIFFTLGDVTLYNADGSTKKVLYDTCIEYNLVQENWYVHTNVKANNFATFVEQSDSDRLEFTDTSGNHAVKEFLSGETDDGKEINFRVDTMKLTTQATAFEYSSKLIALASEVERGSSIQAFVNIGNNEEYYPLEGRITKGLSILKFSDKDGERGKPPVSRLVSISLRDTSKQICKINRMSLIYLPTTDENLDNEE